MYTTSVSLLERLQDLSDQAAWERFVRLYTPLLYRWALRTGMKPQEAGDLVQEILVIIVKELPRFRYQPGRSFRSWLKTVLVNKQRELWRRAKRDPVPAHVNGNDAVAADTTDELEEAEYRHHLVERALRIMREDFEPDTWKACWEYVALDRDPADVATELGISVNTVYLAKSRVLRRLRAELSGLLD